jgi:hypothetical protein
MRVVSKPTKAEIREFVRHAKDDIQKLLVALTEDNGRQVQLFLDSSLTMLEEAANLADERYGVEEENEDDEEEEVDAVVRYECVNCEVEWTGDGTEDESLCNFCEEQGAIVAEYDEEDSSE